MNYRGIEITTKEVRRIFTDCGRRLKARQKLRARDKLPEEPAIYRAVWEQIEWLAAFAGIFNAYMNHITQGDGTKMLDDFKSNMIRNSIEPVDDRICRLFLSITETDPDTITDPALAELFKAATEDGLSDSKD